MTKRFIVGAWSSVLVAGLAGFQRSPSPGPEANLVYQGAFRLPDGSTELTSFDYGGTALAYSAARSSLLLVGHDWHQRVGEVSIPVPTTAPTLSALPVANMLVAPRDVLQGRLKMPQLGYNPKIGGLLPLADGSVIVTAYSSYDAEGTQKQSHFRVMASGEVLGPYEVGGDAGPSEGDAGFVSGYMSFVPVEWQSQLGGPAVTGNCCLNIINRTSLGPALTVFDPAALSLQKKAKMILGYPAHRASLGVCDSTSQLFNCTTAIGGVVFLPGSESVMFFGRQGRGPFCYGDQTLEPAKHNTGPVGSHVCYDPAYESKGPHAYPYVHQVWAYRPSDLALVKAGRRDPWQLKPYATWTFDLPFQSPSRSIIGVASDPATKRIFVAAAAEGQSRPLIHVFTLRTTDSGSAQPR